MAILQFDEYKSKLLALKPTLVDLAEALGLESAADARTAEAPLDGVAPENYHAMSIFPEYFRVGGKWVLAAESRMDCVPVLTDGGRVDVRELVEE